MLTFDFLWAFALLPLPLILWWLLPPFKETTPALRVPFFEQVAQKLNLEPSSGAVVQRSNWAQKILGPLSWILVVTALASPQWLEPPLVRTQSSRDLMLAIDISQSMEARDFKGPDGKPIDRLTAVKSVVRQFIARREGDRIGLIVFGQGAFPQSPLTLDHATVLLLLDEVRIGMAGPQTAIGDAIGVAVKMTEGSTAQDKVLVLLTDGNDTASRVPPDDAARVAADHRVVIHTIGIGDPNASGESKVDLKALERFSGETQGQSFRAEDRRGLERIYGTIDQITPIKVQRTEFRPKIALYYWPLGAAAVLLAIYHAIAMLAALIRRPSAPPAAVSQ
ncbi:Ca-activated chloride channel family protein [Povalibacter uvarum]|uniref:Ca-activated chloride channel family protein n=1 Tax=Povalibacter uvarum TaxID=732238 RepID=A0A841HT56_9GAMM|nr:VWA domain-containing protein [Povalibacter uvarum]MBB6095198.1 Ca-activated chloride channel family protein [Povalibacter uvarum]